MKRMLALVVFLCQFLHSGYSLDFMPTDPPVMETVVRDSDTSLRVYFNEPVSVTGTYTNEFSLSDCKGNAFTISAIADSIAGDSFIRLTTSDLSNANGDLQLIFFNLNNPVTDLDGNALDTDGIGLTLFGNSQFDISTTAYDNHFYTVTEDADPRAFTFNSDGTKMFVLGREIDGIIYEYNLSTPYEIQTMSYTGNSLNVGNGVNLGISDLVFDPSGTKLFMVEFNGRIFIEYAFSTAFDLSTATFISSHGIQNIPATSLSFSADGMEVFILTTSANRLYQYSLQAPYDVSSLSSQVFFNTAISTPISFAFNHNGSKIFIVSRNSRIVKQYALPTFYDISGIQFEQGYNIGGTVTEIATIEFNNNGSKLYGLNTGIDKSVFQFNVGDTQAPLLSQIAIRSSSEIEVLFDEPVLSLASNPANFSVVGDGIGFVVDQIVDTTPADNAITLVVNTSTLSLAALSNSLSVSYSDTNGNGEISDTNCYEMLDDATGITLSIESQAPTLQSGLVLGDTALVLSFDESVQITASTATDFSLTDCRGKVYTINQVLDLTLGDNELTLLTENLSFVVGDLSLQYIDNGNSEVLDLSGNPLANATIAIASQVVDVVAPTISAFSKNSSTELTVTFSENVTTYEQFLTSFTVSDGANLYQPTSINDDIIGDASVRLLFTSLIASSASLTLTYDNSNGDNEIADFSCNVLASDPTGITINLETVAPELIFAQTESSTLLSLFFSEPVQLSSSASPANFSLTDCDGTTFAISSVKDSTQFDRQLFLETSDLSSANGALTLQVTSSNNEITDLSGNGILGGSASYTLGGAFKIANATYLGASELYDFTDQDTYPLAMAFDDQGLNMYMIGLDNKRMYRYQLTDPYDVSSAVLTADSLDFSAQYDVPLQIKFDPTGMQMYMVGVPPSGQLNYLSQFSLTTAYDITSATLSGSYDSKTIDGEGIPTALQFNADGSKMMLLGTELDNILQYSLSTNYDLSTATFLGNTQTLAVTVPSGGSATTFIFNDTGSFMYLMSNNQRLISEFYLDTPFDVITANLNSSAQTFSISETGNPRAFLFNSDGNKAFILGEGLGVVYEYNLVDEESPVLTDVSFTNNTEIALTFSEPVLAQGLFPGDFTVKDKNGLGNAYSVSTIVDASAEDELLSLTVADYSAAEGDLLVTYNDQNSEVRDLNCNDMASDLVGFAIDLDTTAPTLSSATKDSDTQITITFSEAVQTNGGNPTDFTITDGIGNTYVVVSQADGTTLDNQIVLTTDDLSSVIGDLTIIYTNNNSEISDFGNNELVTDNTGIAMDLDTAAPTIISARKDSDTKITLVFDEEVQVVGGGLLNIGIKDGTGLFFSSIQFQSDVTALDNEIELTVTDLSGALGDIFIVYNGTNSSGTGVADFGGNELGSTSNPIEIDLDQTAPTLVSVAKDSDNQLTLTFSEPVQTSGANANDFELIDDLGTSLTVTAIADGSAKDKNLELTVSSLSVVNNDISLTFIGGNNVVSDFGSNELATDNVGVNLDIVAPSVPVISSISDDNGSSSSDFITNDPTLIINGEAEANSTVELFLSNQSIGSVAADGNGDWSFDYSATNLPEGSYSFTATATDATGNASNQSNSYNISIDTTAPAVSSISRISNDKIGEETTSVNFSLTFSEPVSGITGNNFELQLTGTTTGVIGSVTSESLTEFTIVVSDISGEGTIGVNVKDDDSIIDISGNPLGGSGLINGDFTGEVYETKASQIITFPDPSGAYGDVITLSATASSGLSVSYSLLSGPATLSGDQLTITGVGQIEVEASQLGDANFNAGSEVTKTFTPSKASLTVTADDQSITFGDALPSLSISYSGFIGSDAVGDLDTAPSISTTATASSDASTYPISLTGGSDDNYSYGLQDGTLTINQVAQTLTFNAIADIDLASVSTVSLVATSSSGLEVDFALTQGDGAISGTTLTANTTGIFTVEAIQAGSTNYAAATSVSQTFNVNDSRKTDQTITFTALVDNAYGDAAFTLSATASSSLPITFTAAGPATLSGSDLTVTGAGIVTVTASQEGDGTFNPAATVNQSFTVASAALTVIPDDQQIVFGDAIPALTFSYSGFVGSDAVVDLDNEPTLSSLATVTSDVGTYDITASGGSDDNYTYSFQTGTLTIIKADQSITFDPIANVDLAASTTVTLTAAASSGLDVLFTLTNGDGTIAGNVLTINATGNFTVDASQAGNNNFNPATIASQSLQATDSRKTDQTITFEAIADQVYGDQLNLTATASSNLDVTYELTAGAGTITNNVLSIEGIGSYSVTARQAGDASFNPASDLVQGFTVTKATLTATADDQMIEEGDAIPMLTITYVGFKLSDNLSGIDTEPIIGTAATDQSAPGNYPITLTGGDDDLYTLMLVSGILTIDEVLGLYDNSSIQVYPNPVTEYITIDTEELVNLRFFGLNGQLIKEIKQVNGKVDVSNLQTGTYLMEISSEEERTTLRIQKAN